MTSITAPHPATLRLLNAVKRLARSDNFPVLVLILANLCLGALVVTHYGEAWDERSYYHYGERSLLAYLGRAQPGSLDLDEKGPAFAMIATLGADALAALVRGWHFMDAWHFMNFLSFLLGLFFIYRLSRRVAGVLAALGAALLFNTQPLLWGHAFINPKDVAFMSFFLGAVVCGLALDESPALHPEGGVSFWRRLGLALRDGRVWLAALFLGLASATRILGPVAGLLVAAWLALRGGRRSFALLGVYAALGMAIAYLAWPGMWADPLRGYLGAIREAANFPWAGKVLFAGQEYAADALPRRYLPVLIGLQLTEPLLLLALAGLVVAGWGAWRGRLDWRLAGLLAAWFFGPLLAAVIFRPAMYDNFRQFLFILPPLFAFAALSLQALFDRLRRPALAVLVLALLAAPGLWAIFQLHPYQYIYYNRLVGGTAGAFRRYEMDYWLTSYRAATFYVNDVAPENAQVVVWGAPQLVKRYNRSDLQTLSYRKLEEDAPHPLGFAVVSSRHNKDQTLYPQAPVLFRVERGGAVLVVVQQLQARGRAGP